MINYPLDEYVRILHQVLEPHRRQFATPAIAKGLLAKGLPPGMGRGYVEQVALENARAELRGAVGKLPSNVIAAREAEINALANILNDRWARAGLLG